MIDERRQVLHMAQAELSADARGRAGPITINMEIFSSDFLILSVEQPGEGTVFADFCSGLNEPSGGLIQFLGKPWRTLPPDASNALRGRIGRLFQAGNWVNQLSLLDNLLLQQRHHTRLSTEHLLSEASRLARRFGLPGVPLSRPEELAEADLQRAANVRAFLGQPALVLLEEPTRGLQQESKNQLINVIREARDNGTAVVWITTDDTTRQDLTIPATRRYRWLGRKLIEVNQT